MDISNWSNKEIVKLLSTRASITQKELSEKIYKVLEKDYNPNSFASKLRRNSMKISELQAICEILGYNLILEKKNTQN